MKSHNTVNKLYKLGRVLSQLAFTLAVIGFFACIAGYISLLIGRDSIAVIGSIKVHGASLDTLGLNVKSIAAALSGGLAVCAGEAVEAAFAKRYFGNALKAGTPFTHAGAKELMRLGILTLALKTVGAAAGSLVRGFISGRMRLEAVSLANIYSDNAAGITLGVMFIFISLLCRYGAEAIGGKRDEY